jgi:hypothetical protein
MVAVSEYERNKQMGLDMYLKGEKLVMNTSLDLREDGFRLSSKTLDLGYWRKHPNLHGYIVQTFADGKAQDVEALLREAIEEQGLMGTASRSRTSVRSMQTASSGRNEPCSNPQLCSR